MKDEEIADRLGKMQSSEQASRELMELALERGGSDNITIITARARKTA